MVTLAINTASRTTGIALIEDTKVLKEKEWTSANDESEKLMPQIDKLLKSKGLVYNDLNRVIVVKGPGSFTGLRVGVTAANTISYVQKIPVFGVKTFKFLRAKNSETNVNKEKEVLVLLAGRKEIYIQFEEGGRPMLNKVEEGIAMLKEKGVKKVFGELLPDQKKLFKKIKFTTGKKSFGEAILSIKEKDLEQEEVIEPLYIKGPGISSPKPIK